MSDYCTPTVAEARALYEERTGHPEEHDRMIAEVERAAREEGFDQGVDNALRTLESTGLVTDAYKRNPYRKGLSGE